jgi:hypothetical protein
MLVERNLLSTIYGVNEERRLPCIDSVMLCSLFFRFPNDGECRYDSEVNLVETLLIAPLKLLRSLCRLDPSLCGRNCRGLKRHVTG